MHLDPHLMVLADWLLDGPLGGAMPWLRLHPDGTVQGGEGGAVRFWEVEEGMLRLLGQDSVPVLRFDGVGLAGEGRLRLAEAGSGAHALVQRPKDEFPADVRGCRTAVLIRTHVVNSKLFALWWSLANARNFDVFLNIDETGGRTWLEGPRVLRHTVEDCLALGLWRERRDDYLWYFGDYPIYLAMQRLPQYDTFVQVEYDVHFTGESPVFLEALLDRLEAARGERIAAAGIHAGEAMPGWPWAEQARQAFGFSHASFFPFVVIRRAAAEYLLQMRRGEAAAGRAPVHCEAFVPTALKAGGLVMVDLNRLVANAVRPASFGLAPMPLGMSCEPDGGPAGQMHHPVCDQPEFLARSIRYAAHERRPDHLLRWAAHPRLRPGLRARLAEEAARIAAQPA